MRDLLHQNYPALTGTPSVITGALTDGNQALRLSATDTWVVPDSASSSLAVADGAAGGLALEGWFSLPSIPGSTQTILGKAGSYELKVTSAAKLQWILTNGANSVTVTSTATILPGGWYHFAGVYNGDYTGATIFGNQTQGTSQLGMPPDYRAGAATGENNLQVCKYTILEKGQITSVVMDLQRYYDSTGPENIAAVVYRDSTGVPGALLAQSPPQQLSSGTRAWVTFPLSCAVFAGDVWLGFLAGAIFGNDLTSMQIGYETSGGSRKAKNAVVSDGTTFQLTGTADDPFGTAAISDADKFAVYANYTATGRTGAEGQALIYLNGSLDSATAYAHGIADTANNLQHPAGVAVDLDDWAIFNKKLTAVQIATHYAAR